MERSIRRGPLRRLGSALAVALAAGLVQASSCDDNLGHVHPGATTFRVSVGRGQTQANGASLSPSISGDGRYVVFASNAKNLALPSSNFREIFLRDRQTDTVRNVTRLAFSQNQTGLADCDYPFISRNGKWVVFLSKCDFQSSSPFPAQASYNAIRWDVDNDFFDLVSLNWPSVTNFGPPPPDFPTDISNVSISDDGSFVVFETDADNINGVGTFTPNGHHQVYLADFTGGFPAAITLISKAMGGPANQGASDDCMFPRISADGQWIVFQSSATDLVATPLGGKQQVFLAARDGSSMEIVSRADGAAGAVADNHCSGASLSGDGRYVSFLYFGGTLVPGTPSTPLAVRRDRSPSNPALATTSHALTDPFVFFTTGIPTSISDDGRFLSSYVSVRDSGNSIVDLKMQVRDMMGGTMDGSTGIIGTSGGNLGQLPTQYLSADGRWLIFMSLSDTQVVGDTNASVDVFGYGPIR